jgi:hypothetical protein
MQETQISILAYCKLILHAAKYPHAAVNGLLLAKKPTDSDGEDDKKEDVEILDAIPLFHQVRLHCFQLKIQWNNGFKCSVFFTFWV